MPNSLRSKLSSLRYKRLLTDEEYNELIKKLGGHDREIRAKAIDECIKVIEESVWRDTDMLVESIRELKGGAE